MIQLIVGNKGKGKTKHLLEKVNSQVKTTSGNIVYLDKSTKHMYELNNKIRLIDVSEYFIENCDEFIGFISGIISQDHDLQQMFFDSFLSIACVEDKDFLISIAKLEKISNKFGIDFTISVGINKEDLPETLKSKVVVSL